MFTKRKGDKIVVFLVYVNDIDHFFIEVLKYVLTNNFKIKDSGEIKHFLGMEIAKFKHGITLNQRKYALELVSDMGYSGAKPIYSP